MIRLATLAIVALTAAPSPTPASAPTCAPATAFVGTICTPATPGKHPAILLLGGSEGGDSMAKAAPDYASDGYVAASVAYYLAPTLPQTLENVPVETIGAALADIEKRPDVDSSRIAIFGVSKGGELALLAASTYPAIHAVIADVPSPFAWQGISANGAPPATSSWTRGGKPVPYVPFGTAMGAAFATAFGTHAPLVLRPGYAISADGSAERPAFFALEKIDGPVLFLSAGDDRIWNSSAQAKMGLAYLKSAHHPFADEWHDYPAAGHLFLFATPARPFVDAPFVAGLTLALGGTPDANVAAAIDANARIATFLKQSLH
jgi:dienelactone hydrolase